MRPLVKVDFDYDETENTAREYLMRLAVLGQPPGMLPRLPIESEWEWVVRGLQARCYPWEGRREA